MATITFFQVRSVLTKRLLAPNATESEMTAIQEIFELLGWAWPLEGLTRELFEQPVESILKSLQRLACKHFAVKEATRLKHIYVSTPEQDVAVNKILSRQGYIFVCCGSQSGRSSFGKAIEESSTLKSHGIDVVYIKLEDDNVKKVSTEEGLWEYLFKLLARHPSGGRFKDCHRRGYGEPSSFRFEMLCRHGPSLVIVVDNASALGEAPEPVTRGLMASLLSLKDIPGTSFRGIIFLGALSVLNLLSNDIRHIDFAVGTAATVDVHAMEQDRKKKRRIAYTTPFKPSSSHYIEDVLMNSDNFSKEHVHDAMKQLQFMLAVECDAVKLSDDWAKKAADTIHYLTLCTRGSTGACGKVVEDTILQFKESSVALTDWDRFARDILPEQVTHSKAFRPIHSVFNRLIPRHSQLSVQQQWEQQVLKDVLFHRYTTVDIDDAPVLLLQQGVVVMVDSDGELFSNPAQRLLHSDFITMRLMLASPLVAYSLLKQLRWPSIRDHVSSQGLVMPERLTLDWLIEKVVAHLHMDTLLPKFALAGWVPAPTAYACKAQPLVITNTLFEELNNQGKAKPQAAKQGTNRRHKAKQSRARQDANKQDRAPCKCRLVFEARNLRATDLSCQWPDILLTMDQLTTLSLQITANASKASLDEHTRRAYEQVHLSDEGSVQEQGCQSAIVNFLLRGPNESVPQMYFPQSCSHVRVRNVVLPRPGHGNEAMIYTSADRYEAVKLRNPYGSESLKLYRPKDL